MEPPSLEEAQKYLIVRDLSWSLCRLEDTRKSYVSRTELGCPWCARQGPWLGSHCVHICWLPHAQ
jgi:hypothetical protein